MGHYFLDNDIQYNYFNNNIRITWYSMSKILSRFNADTKHIHRDSV